MVATSVAARGLDVKQLILVVNYSCPNHYEDYVHRAGRTGRAGNKVSHFSEPGPFYICIYGLSQICFRLSAHDYVNYYYHNKMLLFLIELHHRPCRKQILMRKNRFKIIFIIPQEAVCFASTSKKKKTMITAFITGQISAKGGKKTHFELLKRLTAAGASEYCWSHTSSHYICTWKGAAQTPKKGNGFHQPR